MVIKSIHSRQILDSRGNPTIECEVELENGTTGRAAVPSGASTGRYEAVELRDGDKMSYRGQGVLKAINNVNLEIAKALIGQDASSQNKIDEAMIRLDGTPNKARLGANAILSVSLAVARASANSEKKPLYEYITKYNPFFSGQYIMPTPEMNVMNGGKHANWATDIQEYMLFPIKAKSITDAIRMNAEVYQVLKGIIKKQGYSTAVGDEGGFAPNVKSNEEPFQLLVQAIVEAGYKVGEDIAFGIDAASTEFYVDDKYKLNKEGRMATSDELGQFLDSLASKYPIISIEDPFAEDDWSAFKTFTERNANRMQIVGDDLYVTNVKRLQIGVEKKTTNAILIKLNQIGTLTETIEAITTARKNGMRTIVSHRSGETEDTFIADLAVGMTAGQIKSGAPARSERVAKYNRLLRIEEELGEKAIYSTQFSPITAA